MDPNAALKLARECAGDIQIARDGGYPGDLAARADELSEFFLALDAWISTGGFLPDAWAGARP